jgi:hypothetical protein
MAAIKTPGGSWQLSRTSSAEAECQPQPKLSVVEKQMPIDRPAKHGIP